MEHTTVRADLFQQGEENQILALNVLEYGTNNTLATHADFVWRYDENPVGRAIIPVIRADSSKIVGFIWIVPLHVRVLGENHSVATASHLIIHPKYRGTLGYIKLIRRFQQIFQDHHIPLHYSFIADEREYRRLRKYNQEAVSTIPLLIKVLDFHSLARSYFTRRWPRLIATAAGRFISPLFNRRDAASSQEITILNINQIDERFDSFWTKVQDKYPITVIRDRAFLNWRFAEISERQYRVLVAESENQMVGYIVLRCSLSRNVQTGLIMDFLVTDDAIGFAAGIQLITEAEVYFRHEKMTLVAGLMASHTGEYKILRHAEYLPLPHFIAPRAFHFAMYIHDQDNNKFSTLSARDWFVTCADFESH